MADLLAHAEYQALAASLDLPQNAFIYGTALSGKTFATTNPAAGQVLGTIAACCPEDVDFAVLNAREAFDDGRWAKLHPAER